MQPWPWESTSAMTRAFSPWIKTQPSPEVPHSQLINAHFWMGSVVYGLLPFDDSGTMSCGHATLPYALYCYILNELRNGKTEFVCPFRDMFNPSEKCGKLWEYQEVRKMALLNRSEKLFVEQKLTENALRKSPNVVECPVCQNFVMKANSSNKLTCGVCFKRGSACSFCFHCLKPWENERDNDSCGRSDCYQDFREPILLEGFSGKGKDDTPQIRACPKCGCLQELVSLMLGCRMVSCPSCRIKYCFRCLRYVEANSKIAPCYEKKIEDDIKKDKNKDHVMMLCEIKKAQEVPNIPPLTFKPGSWPSFI